jgi:hypothetical protein
MRSFAHPVARCSILVLAIIQLMVITIAPMHDQGELGGRGPVQIERLHTNAGAPAHDPGNCPLCQMMNAQLLRPEGTHVAIIVTQVQRPQSLISAIPAARPPPAANQTRAPPLPLA